MPLFIPIVQQQLGLDIVEYHQEDAKIQSTSEREVDLLLKIRLAGETEESLLHIEFQTNNQDMMPRMKEYHDLIYRKYKLEIHHIVIYLGEAKCTIKSQLQEKHIFKGFHLINYK